MSDKETPDPGDSRQAQEAGGGDEPASRPPADDRASDRGDHDPGEGPSAEPGQQTSPPESEAEQDPSQVPPAEAETADKPKAEKKKKARKPKVLTVGIDLGTSHSAISASNGQRSVIESYVGWPVDLVARKVLKKTVLIGEEAVRNRTMVDLHRPLERGLIKEGSERDLTAVRVLLERLLELVAPSEDGDRPRIRAVIGVPAEAMRVNKQQLRNALVGSVDALMIVSEPFAVAYGLDALLHSMVVDIGAGTTDLCVMRGHLPTDEDQRTLERAGDSIDELLLKQIAETYPDAQVSIFMAREWKERHGFVGKPRQKVEVTAPIAGRPTQLDITQALRFACESIVEPIVESMLDLLPRIDPEFQERVRHNVILAGGGSQIAGLRAALQQGLEPVGGGEVRRVPNPVYEGSHGCLSLALDAPGSDWDKLS